MTCFFSSASEKIERRSPVQLSQAIGEATKSFTSSDDMDAFDGKMDAIAKDGWVLVSSIAN